MARSWASTDTVLMGRKTWEGAAGSGGGVDEGHQELRLLAHADERARQGRELVTTDAGEFVRQLKAQPGKDIMVMSGGNFATSLLQAGVIDEVGLNVHPVLLGSGVPAFLDPGSRVNLELTECRQLDGGCVLVTYRVLNTA